jgi:hypothetical protein
VVGNASFLNSEPTLAWLGQFAPEDQSTAAELLRAMTLVSRDQFAERLRQTILRAVEDGDLPVGLYVERELRHRKGVPHKLFKELKGKVKRAIGVGPPAVKPTKAYDADVGSEGLVAQIVSELCREFPKKLFNHPGPDQIRKQSIRRFMLVTDYIGSGKRAWTYLEAAWRVRSVRSWWSARATKGLSFEVISYAASPDGRSRVESHPTRPKVCVAISCPTIRSAFGYDKRLEIRALCLKYAPVKDANPLGFGSVGALIAFAHGVPNNAPLVLYKRGTSWSPLFPARTTSATRLEFAADTVGTENIRSRLLSMRQKRLASSSWIGNANRHAKDVLLVMAALSQRPRHVETISVRTGFTIIEVQQALGRALSHGWIDGRNRLTEDGRGQLAHARKQKKAISPLPEEPEEFYYPKTLRAPAGVSS